MFLASIVLTGVFFERVNAKEIKGIRKGTDIESGGYNVGGKTPEDGQTEEMRYYEREQYGYNIHFPVVAQTAEYAQGDWREIAAARFKETVNTYQSSFAIDDLKDYGFNADYESGDWNELYNIFYELMYGSDCFFVSGFGISSRRIYPLYDEYMNGGAVDTAAIDRDRAAVERAMESALSGISPEMTDIEKALYLHDWIVVQTDYAYEEYLALFDGVEMPAYCSNVTGVFLKHKAVCGGYANTYSVLLQRAGIDSYVVSSGELNHAWNLVSIDGSWYHVDCTWDDPVYNMTDPSMSDSRACGDYWNEGGVSHSNFLKGDSGIIAAGHAVRGHEDMIAEGHKCWNMQGLPQTEDTDPFDGYAFRIFGMDSPMYYHDGYWYYGMGNYICRSLVDFSDIRYVDYNGRKCINMHKINGTLYYADPHTLYRVTVDDLENLVPVAEYGEEFTIGEFAVKGSQVILNGKNNLTGGWEKKTIDILDLVQAAELKIETLPSKLVYGVGEDLDMSGIKLAVITATGEQIPLDITACTVSGFNSAVFGQTTVTVAYKNVSACFEVLIDLVFDELQPVYQGIDYSPVFDVRYYYANNPDLQSAFGTDSQQLFSHFLNHGMAEGRAGCAGFSVGAYRLNYRDLREAYGDSWPDYYMHYIRYGRGEGREAASLYYAPVFDAGYYASRYQDVAAAFGDNEENLYIHFVDYGMAEGRQGTLHFDVAAYKESNADLSYAFGDNLREYYNHYIQYGRFENRRTESAIMGEVFNADYYYANNADVAAAAGNDPEALYRHFSVYGMDEGRRASEGFDVKYYKESYGDLRAAYGDDGYRRYFEHYLFYGYYEGRDKTVRQ